VFLFLPCSKPAKSAMLEKIAFTLGVR